MDGMGSPTRNRASWGTRSLPHLHMARRWGGRGSSFQLLSFPGSQTLSKRFLGPRLDESA